MLSRLTSQASLPGLRCSAAPSESPRSSLYVKGGEITVLYGGLRSPDLISPSLSRNLPLGRRSTGSPHPTNRTAGHPDRQRGAQSIYLGLAAAHEARVQATCADGMLVGHPGEEALQAEAIASMRGSAVPEKKTRVSAQSARRLMGLTRRACRQEGTHFLWSVYQ